MYNENHDTFANVHLPGPAISRLLGISLLEYYNLNHDVTEQTDNSGNVYAYTIKVHSDNDAEILSKMKLPDNNMLIFEAASVFSY